MVLIYIERHLESKTGTILNRWTPCVKRYTGMGHYPYCIHQKFLPFHISQLIQREYLVLFLLVKFSIPCL